MPDVKDMDLMREYADRDSEPAFAELVHRHINLVYSVALRYAGNSQDAQDVTQAVFIILAQKAASLRQRSTLTGWLYETTRFTTMRFLRTKTRRQFREQEAYMQSTLNESDTDSAWRQLAPLLEEAMTRLNEKERTLLALRFFENKSGAEAATLLGIEEWATRKRVERAVEKLRTFFAWRGIRVSAGVLTGAISANSIQAAPVALAKSVTAVAIMKGATASGSTLTLIKGALKIMAWTKAKTTIVVGVAAILAVGTPTIVIHQYLNHWIFTSTKELSSDVDAQYARYTGMTPEQAAKTFFEACSREDWTEAAKFWPPGSRYPLDDRLKNYFGGLQIVSLGKPFTGWLFGRKTGGVWVPYKIQLKNGRVRNFALHLQLDNKNWYVNGGL